MRKTHMAFRIKDAETDTLEIDVYDVVGEDFWFGGVTAKDVREKLKAAGGVRKIQVRINSAGGDVFDGFAIYNLLREHKARVTVDIDGLAASIASVIAMAGDKIRIASNAMLMIHNPWMVTMGDGEQLRHDAETLDKVRNQIASTYAARTGQKVEDIVGWMADETWLTAEEALDKGFVTDVTPAKAIAARWDLSRFKAVPETLREAVLAPPPPPAPAPNQPAAQVGGRQPENTMDIEALKADLKNAETALANVKAELAEANKIVAARDAALASLTADRDQALKLAKLPEAKTLTEAVTALVKRADEANEIAVAAEVDALVGPKLYPAERDTMVALALKDRDTFDNIVAARPDLEVVGARKAVDPNAPAPADAAGAADAAGDELSAAAERRGAELS